MSIESGGERCTACGAISPALSAFCGECGRPLQPVEQAEPLGMPDAPEPPAAEPSEPPTPPAPQAQPVAQDAPPPPVAIPADVLAGERQLGSGYVIGESIGHGAMGQVFRGRTRDGEPVAIKILRPELGGDPAIVARFLQERTILTHLDHPNLVRVHDLVAEGATLAIVMDLVEGTDLRAALKAQGGTMPPAEAVAITTGLLRGLAAVHGAGVVHRDLKPENVLLANSSSPGGPIPRITDFGVSHIAQSDRVTHHTSVIGTPNYMAPELADDSPPTVSSDLYSVGCMLFELLCGVTPFAGGGPLAVLRRHAEQQPGRPAGIPDPLWAEISKLLAKDPAARPASALYVAERLANLQPALVGLPASELLSSPPLPDPDSPTIHSPLVTTARVPAATHAAERNGRKRIALIAAVLALVLAGGGTAYALTRPSHSSPKVAAPASPSVTAAPTPTPSATPTPTPSASAVVSAVAPQSGLPVSSAPASPTATAPDPNAPLPSLVGLTTSDATDTLTKLGVQYEMKETLDPSKTDGTVVAQTPAAGQPAGPLVIVTVARQPVVLYLSDIQAVAGRPETGVVTVNGQTYAHSITTGNLGCGSSQSFEYDLGRHYRELHTTAGVTDSSSSAAHQLVEVFLDGRKVSSTILSLGKPIPLGIDVTGVLRLKLTITETTCGSGFNDYSVVAFADAQLLGVPSEVPTPSPSN